VKSVEIVGSNPAMIVEMLKNLLSKDLQSLTKADIIAFLSAQLTAMGVPDAPALVARAQALVADVTKAVESSGMKDELVAFAKSTKGRLKNDVDVIGLLRRSQAFVSSLRTVVVPFVCEGLLTVAIPDVHTQKSVLGSKLNITITKMTLSSLKIVPEDLVVDLSETDRTIKIAIKKISAALNGFQWHVEKKSWPTVDNGGLADASVQKGSVDFLLQLIRHNEVPEPSPCVEEDPETSTSTSTTSKASSKDSRRKRSTLQPRASVVVDHEPDDLVLMSSQECSPPLSDQEDLEHENEEEGTSSPSSPSSVPSSSEESTPDVFPFHVNVVSSKLTVADFALKLHGCKMEGLYNALLGAFNGWVRTAVEKELNRMLLKLTLKLSVRVNQLIQSIMAKMLSASASHSDESESAAPTETNTNSIKTTQHTSSTQIQPPVSSAGDVGTDSAK